MAYILCIHFCIYYGISICSCFIHDLEKKNDYVYMVFCILFTQPVNILFTSYNAIIHVEKIKLYVRWNEGNI